MVAKKGKNGLLSMWQLLSLLLGKGSFHQVTLLSRSFTLMKSMAVGCFCFFLPYGEIINFTFLIFLSA